MIHVKFKVVGLLVVVTLILDHCTCYHWLFFILFVVVMQQMCINTFTHRNNCVCYMSCFFHYREVLVIQLGTAYSFLADRTTSRAFGIHCRLSVVCRLSVTFCIVAKR